MSARGVKLDRALPGIICVVAAVVLFVPLWLVSGIGDASDTLDPSAPAVTLVGLGVIFRAVARNLLRTSVGVVSRTASRAVSRRWTRGMLKSVTAFVKAASRDAGDSRLDEMTGKARQHPAVSIGLGFVALAVSYAGVLMLVEADLRASLLGVVSLPLAAMLGALPLFVYIGAAHFAARALDVKVTPQTALDGLILQAYFTFSGSFLPLTTDVTYEGTQKRCASVAGVVLGVLLACHLAVWGLARSTGSELLLHLASIFLIYAFIVSFPFRPLDGHHIWSISKLLWLVCFLPFALCFHYNLPKAFYVIM